MPLQIVTVTEIEKKKNRRYDTSDRHTSLFYSAIDLYADTYYDSVYYDSIATAVFVIFGISH